MIIWLEFNDELTVYLIFTPANILLKVKSSNFTKVVNGNQYILLNGLVKEILQSQKGYNLQNTKLNTIIIHLM